mgnify:FL=1
MNGIIIINKNQGYTSHDIVHKIKRISKEKVGHTGTLDPMAQGVLPILIGKATQCSKYLINHDKIYKVKLKLGIKTDTADSEGNIIEKTEISPEILNEKKILQAINSMKGKQEQIPPIYSAIKVNGKKLYEYARKGQEVEIKPRQIEIYNIILNNIDKENKIIEYTVNCSKGTYIRSLCEDIAKKLGTIGYMENLIRLKAGEFSIENSITLEEILNAENPYNVLEKNIITLEEFFKDKETINLNEKRLQLFLNGVNLTEQKKDGIYKIYTNNNFIGTGTLKEKKLKRDIIL